MVSKVMKIKSPILILEAKGSPKQSNNFKYVHAERVGKIIEFRDAGGAGYFLALSKSKKISIRMTWDVSEAEHKILSKLSDSHAKVKVKGVLEVWKDGSEGFSSDYAVAISK